MGISLGFGLGPVRVSTRGVGVGFGAGPVRAGAGVPWSGGQRHSVRYRWVPQPPPPPASRVCVPAAVPAQGSFAKRHPVLTVLTVLGLSTAAVAAFPAGLVWFLFQMFTVRDDGWAVELVSLTVQLFVMVAVVSPVMFVFTGHRKARRHAVIASRADYEHHALLSGNTTVGVHGRYQPVTWSGVHAGTPAGPASSPAFHRA